MSRGRMGIWAILVVALLLAGPAAASEVNTLSKEEITDGWILLFDGATTFGWETVGGAKWKVADGALVSEEGTGWILTTTEFTDFTLKAEFRVGEGGNSGICFRAAKGPKPYETGFEMQIGDHVRGEPTGSIEHVAAAPPGARKGSAWQSAVITAEGDHLTVVLDGKPLVDTHSPKHGRGVIGFQRGQPERKVEFRNVCLKPLAQKPIFNGKDLNGWQMLPGHKSVYSVTPAGELNVKDGNGEIQTEGQWADFCFQLDIISNGKHLNSGVFFRGIPGQFWTGYESQIRNQWEGEDRTKPVDFGTGGLYGHQPARRVVPSDHEWFTKTIVAHGRHMAVWVNGHQVSDWTDPRPLNDSPRQGCRLKAGIISLQGHDPTTDLSFRNLRIAEYPKREPAK
ncbi:MAG TPA: DUF1080 domain-containing protein [Planctomycetota bacterium]|nr:DUF1080 domain-containing protein [Planctomycetota bacterium]